MTARHAPPRRAPSWPFRAVAAGAVVMFAAGAVAALAATVAPRVQGATVRGVSVATSEAGTTTPVVTTTEATEVPRIALSAPRTASNPRARVVLTLSVSPSASQGLSEGRTAAAPTTTTAAPTTTTTARARRQRQWPPITTTATTTTASTTTDATGSPTDSNSSVDVPTTPTLP